MPMNLRVLLSVVFVSVFCPAALFAAAVYEWSGAECLSDSGDSAFVGMKCASDADCQEGLGCVLSGESGGFCTYECVEDSDCGHASKCLQSNLAEKPLCIPVSCPDDVAWPQDSECNSKLAAGDGDYNPNTTRKECKTVCACDQSQGVDSVAVVMLIILAGAFTVLRLRCGAGKKSLDL